MTRTSRSTSTTPQSGSATRPNEVLVDGGWGECLADGGGGTAHVGPWSVRASPAERKRASLEVYEFGELLDVMVASALGDHQVLRGARCRVGTDGPTGFAWGRLPIDGSLPEITFTNGGLLGRSHRPARVVQLADAFWLAWADGPPCGSVQVRVPHDDSLSARMRAGRTS
ncbi:hypothetical protein [Kitasatospora cystarginea]|uniref:hypothetical protein n=1 Tax=Kitasatospora cystarginea TaxID=58350 RepID=UPI0031D70184